MPISGSDSIVVEELADVLYEFLPASGNNTTSFPLAARQAGVADLWLLEGSKRPAITRFLRLVLDQRRDRLASVVLCVVQQSRTWRQKKGNPLTRAEVEKVNHLVEKLGIRVTALHDPVFLAALAPSSAPVGKEQTTSAPKQHGKLAALQADLLNLARTADGQARGYAFERWLKELFEIHGLQPQKPFRLVGEQIDGSFLIGTEVYLLEAKWQNSKCALAELLTFSGKIDGKAVWARGVFVGYSGFSEDGLAAFARGRKTNLICIDGLDLHSMLERKLSIQDMFVLKLRAAAETNKAYVPLSELIR